MLTTRLLIVALFVLLLAALTGGAIPQYRVNVSAFVVARDRLNLLGNAANKDIPQTELFIVRLEQHEPIAKDSLYLNVYYQWRVGEPTLPTEFFKARRQWRFVLARIPDCDGTVRQMVTTYNEKREPSPFDPTLLPIRLDGAKDEHIPLDKTLPCYLLEAICWNRTTSSC